MRLIVLGSSAAYPQAGGACSGYLIEEGATRLLVDCGTGVVANLQRYMALGDVTHIAISHMHADHFFDLFPFRYALRYGPAGGGRPALWLPPGGEQTVNHIASALDASPSFFSEVFAVAEYNPGVALRAGDFTIEFAPARHYIPSYAMAVAGTRRLAYSSDTGPSPEVVRLARGADLFLCEAGLCLPEEGEERGHLTAQEAAGMAREAGVQRLVLTHFWPTCDYSGALRDATLAFGGPIEVAEANRIYTV